MQPEANLELASFGVVLFSVCSNFLSPSPNVPIRSLACSNIQQDLPLVLWEPCQKRARVACYSNGHVSLNDALLSETPSTRSLPGHAASRCGHSESHPQLGPTGT